MYFSLFTVLQFPSCRNSFTYTSEFREPFEATTYYYYYYYYYHHHRRYCRRNHRLSRLMQMGGYTLSWL
jgi:hypothetical protein